MNQDAFFTSMGIILSMLVIWAIIAALVSIHRSFGLLSTRGFGWGVVVVLGSLFGLILYRFCRQPIEGLVDTMFQRR